MKKTVFFILSLFILIALIGNVLAITGAIGNGRMTLYPSLGDTIEKYVLVKNTNNVSINIEIFATGDLQKSVIIKDANFTLAPGEEKKAYFTIQAEKEGKTETKINVKFTPVDGKNGIGLSSTVILITKEGNKTPLTGRIIEDIKNAGQLAIGLSITGFIFMIFIILLIISLVKKKKTKSKKSFKKDE